MKKSRIFLWMIYLPLITSFICTPLGLKAQDSGSEILSVEQLDQMLAPIALYPDSLLSQLLMASTYPLEVVEADRWIKANPGLVADVLDSMLEPMNWDPSVKSLCYFPQVLAMMDENIDWTTRLGDAFLSQEQDVMNSIQRLRQKAKAAGNLNTTDQQRVISSEDALVIEPAYPNIVYVPLYDPDAVYGPWRYPAYPPFVIYPLGYVLSSFVSFTAGIFGGFCLFGGFDWGHRRVVVNNTTFIVDQTRFHGIRNYNPRQNRWEWTHDPFHRRGVVYENRAIRQRFGSERFLPEVPGREQLRRGEMERRGIIPQRVSPVPRAEPVRPGIQPPGRQPGVIGPVQPGRETARPPFEGPRREVGRPQVPESSSPSLRGREGGRPSVEDLRRELGRTQIPAPVSPPRAGSEVTRPSPELPRRELNRPQVPTEQAQRYRGFETSPRGPAPGGGPVAVPRPEYRPSPFSGLGEGGSAESSAGQRGQTSRNSDVFRNQFRTTAPAQIQPATPPQPRPTAPAAPRIAPQEVPQGGRSFEPPSGGSGRQGSGVGAPARPQAGGGRERR
jgi:hypothetical protein